MCRFLTSIWGGFFSISLNLHSTGDSAVGFSTGEISHVNESVIEGGKEMDNTEVDNIFIGTDLRWTEIGLLLFLHFNFLLWWLYNRGLENQSVQLTICVCYLIMIESV